MRMIRLTSGVDSQVLLCDLNPTIACPQVDVVNHGHWLNVWFKLSDLRDECVEESSHLFLVLEVVFEGFWHTGSPRDRYTRVQNDVWKELYLACACAT